jgi:hypothetical protein
MVLHLAGHSTKGRAIVLLEIARNIRAHEDAMISAKDQAGSLSNSPLPSRG